VSPATSRVPADLRLQRLLAILSWCADQDGPTFAEVMDRFDIGASQLRDDLELAAMVGSDSEDIADMPIEVVVDDGRVWVFLHAFQRPLRLTPDEGLALVATGAALQSVPGADPKGPLARALTKLAGVLGVEPDEAIGIDLGLPHGDTFTILRDAVAGRRQVELDYYSFGRDEHTHRVVDPWRVFADQGAWYVVGWCHRVDDQRSFRLDRIAEVTPLDTTFDPPAVPPDLGLYHADADAPRVVLDLEPAARWVAEVHPTESVEDLGDGRLRVTLTVSARPWLERLLLTLGPLAALVHVDERLGGPETARAAARRVLARYRAGGTVR
jgi:proteasome accessory factor C